jgi:peptidoglycan hydrolase-like protein with peptidoglycan-binding domain
MFGHRLLFELRGAARLIATPRIVTTMRWLRRLDQQQRVGAAIVAVFAVFAIVFAFTVRGSSDDPPAVAADDRPARTTRPTTTVRVGITTTSVTDDATTTSTTSTTSSSSTSTTSLPELPLLETLAVGTEGDDVLELQQLLNQVIEADLPEDGSYGRATERAVEEFQNAVGLPTTGEADHDTRILLAELAAGEIQAFRDWPIPTLGDGSADGCQVVVIGDSLMAGRPALHESALAQIPCESSVDAVSGRSLIDGWQCRVVASEGGDSSITLLSDPQPFNESCAPAGLELLRLWAEQDALGDIVVIALGTNDAGLFTTEGWIDHWQTALDLAGERPVVFITTRARAGSSRESTQEAYSGALRVWCDEQPQCVLGDWAATEAASDPSVYFDAVHLRANGTEARAAFVRDVVRLLPDDDLNVRPTTTTSTTVPPTTTTTSTTTSTTSTTSTTTSTTTTTTTSPTVPPTPTTTSTTTSTTSTTTSTTTTEP